MVQALKEIINLEDYDEASLKEALSNFTCVSQEDSQDVLDFLVNKAISKEKQGETRTYLIIDDNAWQNGNLKINGYFSIALNVLYFSKNVSKETIEAIFNDSNKQNCPAYLIGQLARSIDSKRGDGKTYLEIALSYIKQVNELIGGRIIYLDCRPNRQAYYEKNGFKFLQQKHKSELIQMYKVI